MPHFEVRTLDVAIWVQVALDMAMKYRLLITLDMAIEAQATLDMDIMPVNLISIRFNQTSTLPDC